MPDVSALFGARFELFVDGRSLYGFEKVRIERSIEAAAAGFEFTIADTPDPTWPIPLGEACELRVDGETFVAGFIENVAPHATKTSHEVRIGGRERTCDVVDCSPLDPVLHNFSELTIDAIAAKLCAPHGVKVVTETDPGEPFFRFALQPGESAYDALERASRLRGIVVTSDGLGKLVLTTPGQKRAVTSLEWGRNLIGFDARFDASQRFHHYSVVGQESGSDEEFADGVAVEGEAFDDSVRKNRELRVLAEGQVWIAVAAIRAQWEASWRAARGNQVTVSVEGWRQNPFPGQGSPTQPFWVPNLIVHTKVPALRIDNELLVSTVVYHRDREGGTSCDLTLMRPDAFQPKPTLLTENDIGMGGDETDQQD